MPSATVYSKPLLPRCSRVPYPFIFPPKDTQVKNEETKVLRGRQTRP